MDENEDFLFFFNHIFNLVEKLFLIINKNLLYLPIKTKLINLDLA